MGIIQKAGRYILGEIAGMRPDMVKAGLMSPDSSAYDPKTSLVDPLSFQSLSAFGYREKFSLLDYSRLRAISLNDSVVAAVIQTRLNQVAGFATLQADKHTGGFTIRMRDRDKKPNSAAQKRIKEFQEFMINCGVPEQFEDTPERKRRDNFDTFLRKLTRDSLTYDQANFEITPRRNGMPYEFGAVDASTIRLIPDKKELIDQFNNERAAQYALQTMKDTIKVAENSGKVFKPRHPKYVQVINGIIKHDYDEWEMAFGVRNPRTDVMSYGYGFSEIEMLVTIITAHMNAETYNRKFFTQGTNAKGILHFEGQVPRDQLQEFRHQFHMQAAGIANSFKTPIIATAKETKLQWMDFQKSNREMEFGRWLEYCIKVVCSVYQIDPIEIGFDISRMGSGASQGGGYGMGASAGDPTSKISSSQDKGLKPLLRFLQSLINDYIVYRLDADFEFEFVGLNADSDSEALDKIGKEVKTFKTINEVRAEQDRPALPPLDQIESPGDLLLDSTLLTIWGQERQAKQQQDMMAQQGQDGGDGNPVGEDEQPDYQNMSDEDLQQQYKKLQEGGGGGGSLSQGGVNKSMPRLTRTLRL